MAHRLVFDPRIPNDITLALDYYEQLSTELAVRFRAQVNARFDDIEQRAESFPIDVAPVRFARLRRFPYLIFFVVKPEFVSIIAILHGSSAPAQWRDRLAN